LNQWRERVLFASTWRTIQSLKIEYVDGSEGLDVYFDKKMLAVKGVNQLDTTKFMGYLGQYDGFILNDYLDKGEFPKYDSLSTTPPFAKLFLKDIDRNKSIELRVFPLLPNEKFHLMLDQNDQMIVIDEIRTEKLLKNPTHFVLR